MQIVPLTAVLPTTCFALKMVLRNASIIVVAIGVPSQRRHLHQVQGPSHRQHRQHRQCRQHLRRLLSQHPSRHLLRLRSAAGVIGVLRMSAAATRQVHKADVVTPTGASLAPPSPIAAALSMSCDAALGCWEQALRTSGRCLDSPFS